MRRQAGARDVAAALCVSAAAHANARAAALPRVWRRAQQIEAQLLELQRRLAASEARLVVSREQRGVEYAGPLCAERDARPGRLRSLASPAQEATEESRAVRAQHAAVSEELSMERDASRRLRLQATVLQGHIEVRVVRLA